MVLTPHPTPVTGDPGPDLTNLYNILRSSKQKFGRFVRPDREKIEHVERDSDEGTFHVKEVNNHVNERTDDKEIELVHIDDAFLGE